LESQIKPLAQSLSKFGLTDYESMVYLTLIRNGPSGIKDIEAKSNVPRTKIYPVLKNLEKRKLVSIMPGKPIKAKGHAPDSSLLSPIRSMEQDLKTMKRTIQELRKLHETSSASDQFEKKEYWVTRKQDDAIKSITETINNSSEELLLFLNHEGLEIVSLYCYELLNHAALNEVPVKIMINANKSDLAILRRFTELITIKYVPFAPQVSMLFSDGKELLIFKRMFLLDNRSSTISVEHYSGGSVCELMKNSLTGIEWTSGKDFSTLLPVIENSWMPEDAIINPKENQASPLLYLYLMDLITTNFGQKRDAAFADLGKKTLESMMKGPTNYVQTTLANSLSVLSSLYLIYEGVQAKYSYDDPVNLITCELSGGLTLAYKTAADRGFPIPPSVWGFFFLGLLDVFGFDCKVIDSVFNSSNNYWLIQYRLTNRQSPTPDKTDLTASALLPKAP
jgi:sugar-specific transcriptional regulator TrmB